MNDEESQLVRDLIRSRRTASLGTLHKGEPAVSMVPFAVTGNAAFVVHVSGLAAHTRDMTAHPRVSMMIAAAEEPGTMPQALPRVSMEAIARSVDRESPDYTVAREAYLTRFPDSEPMFSLGDFSIFLIEPQSARLIGGFGRALTVSAEDLATALRE